MKTITRQRLASFGMLGFAFMALAEAIFKASGEFRILWIIVAMLCVQNTTTMERVFTLEKTLAGGPQEDTKSPTTTQI
jgi:hypothetical protein